MMEQMAISDYLGLLIVLVILYPFAVVIIQFIVFDKNKRNKVTNWFNVVFILVLGVLLYLHLQTEVFYGKSLIDQWHTLNPQTE